MSVPCWGLGGDPTSPGPPARGTQSVLTSGLSLAVCGAVVAAGTRGCSEVATELAPAAVEPEVSARSLGWVRGLWVVGTPGLPCGSRMVPGRDVGAGLGWGLVLSCPLSPDDVGLAATDPAAASAWKK